MSNTSKKYEPRPYFNAAVLAQLEEDEREEQNPSNKDGQPSAEADTQKNNSATSESEATYEKRWKDLKKHYDEEVTKLRRQLQEVEANAQPTFTPPKTAEDLEKFQKQYPEFYDVMLSVAYQQAAQAGDTSGLRIRQLEERLMQAEQERAFTAIERAHPDYVSVVQSKGFLEWLDLQNSAIQAWVKENSTDASLFIRALDLYKLDSGITKQMPTRDNEKKSAETKKGKDTSAAEDVSVSGNSVTVGDTNKRVWSRSEIGRLSPKDFEKYEEEIMEAYAEGRISDK